MYVCCALPDRYMTSFTLTTAVRDYRQAWSERRIWTTLAMRSFTHSYRRTVLGPWWNSVDQLLYTFGFAALSSWLFGGEFEDRFTYVGVGIAVFTTITQAISGGLSAFVGSTNLRNSGLSLSGRVVKEMLVVLMTFGFRVLPLALVVPFTRYSLSVAILWLVPSLVLGGLSAIAIGLVLAVLFARFRDLSPMINLVLRLAFFASPVFWHIDTVSQPDSLVRLTSLNPFAQYLEVFRNPILGLVPSTYCVIFVVASTILLCGTSSVLLSQYHKRIPYLIS